MKRFDSIMKIFFAELISFVGIFCYVWYNSVRNFRRLFLTVCTADMLAESISYGIFVSISVWMCVLFFYEEFINRFMSEQIVIRYTAKWKVYVRQVCWVITGGIGLTALLFVNFIAAANIMGLELYTWDRMDSVFAFMTKTCLREDCSVFIIFVELYANALLQFLFFLFILLALRWTLKSKSWVLLLTALIFVTEIMGRGVLIVRADVFAMFATGEFDGASLWQMSVMVVLALAAGWLASIRKEFYNEKK